jgi:ribose 5-phosphate isomerase A
VVVRGGPASPDGGIIADFVDPFEHPGKLAARLDATPGVVDHGLFAPEMVCEVLVGRAASVERIEGAAR